MRQRARCSDILSAQKCSLRSVVYCVNHQKATYPSQAQNKLFVLELLICIICNRGLQIYLVSVNIVSYIINLQKMYEFYILK
jgi:hypothetical protein